MDAEPLRRIKVAVVGAGLMGQRHALGYRSLPGVELMAVADASEAICERIGNEFGIPAFRDWNAVMTIPGLDAVSICLPDNLHKAAVLDAFRHGLAVLLEKPIATDPEDARVMAEAGAISVAPFMVGHMLRFDPRYQGARRALREGRVGDLSHVKTCRNSARGATRRYGASTTLAWHVGIHDIDLVEWMTGRRFTEVLAYGSARELAGQGHYDAVLVLGRLEGGVPCTMEFSWILPEYFRSGLDAGMEIAGTQGQISVHGLDQGLRIADSETITYPDTTRWVELSDGSHGGILVTELAHFVGCVRTGARPEIDVADAISSAHVVHAIERSLISGQVERP